MTDFPYIDKTCVECGEIFEVQTNIAWRARYCHQCRERRQREYFLQRNQRRREERANRSKSVDRRKDATHNMALWTVLQDPGPEPYDPGASFDRYDVKYMMDMGHINDGTILEKNTPRSKRVEIYRVTRDLLGHMVMVPTQRPQ